MRYPALSIRRHPWLTALAITALLLPWSGRALAAGAAELTRVRFQLRAECTCASCGFDLQRQLRKLPGVARVDLAARERVLSVTFDEAQAPLSRLAASVACCELGKRCALIVDLGDAAGKPVPPSGSIPGVRAAELDRKGSRLLVQLDGDARLTTAELTRALARVGLVAHVDQPATKER